MNQRNAKKFNKKITKALLEMGATITSEKDYVTEFVLSTIVGKLSIQLFPDHKHVYSIFSRFENVKEAKEKFDCNPYSGKYNFLVSDRLDINEVIEGATFHFECTQPNN